MSISYKDAKISDVVDFYKDKFVSHNSYNFTKHPIHFYDINYYKMLWVFSNVKPNSKVLDFGCGSGTLSCLKSKNCELTGVDISSASLDIAKNENFYDYTFCTDIFSFRHEEEYFDYIVSLDVFGHIEFHAKDAVIKELKKYLKPSGAMLHGIECGAVPYDEMSEDDLKKFVEVDGHIGIEGRNENMKRFKKFFKFVNADLRYDVLLPWGEIIKQADQYESSIFGDILLNFIKTFNHDEIRAFDVAMGLAMRLMNDNHSISNDNNGGFLFLTASDDEITPNMIESPITNQAPDTDLLSNPYMFLKGWHEVECSKIKFRWSARTSLIAINNKKGYTFTCDIIAGNPLIKKGNKNTIYVIDNDSNKIIEKLVFSLANEKKQFLYKVCSDKITIRFFSETTFIPVFSIGNNDDGRELSFMVCNVALQLIN
jgi:SAM-dependent methyltransferase